MPPERSYGRKSVRLSGTPSDLMAPDPAGWTAQVLTLFPEVFPGVLGASLTGRALREGLWHLDAIDLREFGLGRHRDVDDTPAGGGAGMVLRADVLGPAIEATRARAVETLPLFYLSPRGVPFTQAIAEQLAAGPGLSLICGRFEGVDERVLEEYGVRELSLGDFVLSGGEIAAQAVIDATVRLRAGVLGNAASATDESFSDGLLEHPHYTRPAEWKGRRIPDVLLSGNHAAIDAWRRAESERITRERRPDLWARRTTQDDD